MSDAVMPEELVAEAAGTAREDEEAVAGWGFADPGPTQHRGRPPCRIREPPGEPGGRRGRPRRGPGPSIRSGTALRRNAWILGLSAFLVALLVFTKMIQPSTGRSPCRGSGRRSARSPWPPSRRRSSCISGGIDLSIGSMMALHERHRGPADGRARRGVGSRSSLACSAWGSCSAGSTVGRVRPACPTSSSPSPCRSCAGLALLVRYSPGGPAPSGSRRSAIGPLAGVGPPGTTWCLSWSCA